MTNERDVRAMLQARRDTTSDPVAADPVRRGILGRLADFFSPENAREFVASQDRLRERQQANRDQFRRRRGVMVRDALDFLVGGMDDGPGDDWPPLRHEREGFIQGGDEGLARAREQHRNRPRERP